MSPGVQPIIQLDLVHPYGIPPPPQSWTQWLQNFWEQSVASVHLQGQQVTPRNSQEAKMENESPLSGGQRILDKHTHKQLPKNLVLGA